METPENQEIENLKEQQLSNLSGVPPRNYEDLPKHAPIEWLKKES